MSTWPNVGKERCRVRKSLLRVKSLPILSFDLRVRVRGWRGHRSEPSCGHPTGNSQIEIGRSLGRRLGQHAGRGDPFLIRLVGRSEDQFGPVVELDDDAALVVEELVGAGAEPVRGGASDLE